MTARGVGVAFGYEPAVVHGEAVFFRSEKVVKTFVGRAFEVIVPLLDGTRDEDALVDELLDLAPAPELYFALAEMRAANVLSDGCKKASSDLELLAASAGTSIDAVAARILAASVKVVSLRNGEAAPLHVAMARLGIREAPEPKLKIVVADDYLAADLDAINRQALANKEPWLLLKICGEEVWFGPLFVPGETGCWACLAHRQHTNRVIERFIERRLGIGSTRRANLPMPLQAQEAVAGLAALQVARILLADSANLKGGVISFDLGTMSSSRHVLTRRPQCTACGGTIANAVAHGIPADDRFVSLENGHRQSQPDETFDRYKHHISHVTGIVTSFDRIGQAPNYTFAAGHNFAVRYGDLRILHRSLRSRSGGKGRTEAQAKASALCEALERYSAIADGTEVRVFDTFDKLGPDAIHPNASMLFSDRQYDERDTWNARDSLFNRVPLRFDPSAVLPWSPIRSLITGRIFFLPTCYLYFGSEHIPPSSATFSCPPDSNGNAGGNTLDEAILQGFMELVERDAVSIWWYNMISVPGVDIASFENPYLERLQQYYFERHREFWVLDISTDLGVPAFVAVSRRLIGPSEDIILGFGASLDATVAIERAVTEMNQMLPLQEDLPREHGDQDAAWWSANATIANQPYLTASMTVLPRQRPDYRVPPEGVEACIEACRRVALSKGLDILVLDQTRPDVGLNVAKVVVPGLRHFWARLAPGRLYDVPVASGLLNRPRSELELNPVAMFL